VAVLPAAALQQEQTLNPKAAALLAQDELDAYRSAPKPRQLVVLQLRQLITLAKLDHSKVCCWVHRF
jgi:hypothetical protein